MIGQTVRNLRKQKRIFQTELAKILHVSQQTITAWETGKAEPSSSAVSNLADYFNVTTDYLLGRPEKQTESRQQTISEAIETAMANDGKELDQHDKDVIKSLIEAYLDNKR